MDHGVSKKKSIASAGVMNGQQQQDVVREITARALLHTAQTQEQHLDNKLQSYEHILEDDDAIERLRVRRIEQMKNDTKQRQLYLSYGHGQYTEIRGIDIAKDFFTITKQSMKVVVHFYKTSSARVCDIFHKHLNILASKYIQTRFIKINVESVLEDSIASAVGSNNGVTFLVERLRISVMPTLVLIKDRKTIHSIVGFDELGGTDKFSTRTLASILRHHGVLGFETNDDHYDDDEDEDDDNNDDNDNVYRSRNRISTGNSRPSTSTRSNTYGRHKTNTDMRSIYDLDDDE